MRFRYLRHKTAHLEELVRHAFVADQFDQDVCPFKLGRIGHVFVEERIVIGGSDPRRGNAGEIRHRFACIQRGETPVVAVFVVA
jgi:hypothetical protein